MLLKMLRLPIVIAIVALLLTFIWAGIGGAVTAGILAVLGVSLSIDNAVVNAKVLGRMSPNWQQVFLSLGIVIAVFGMRFLFPLTVVALATHLSPLGALSLAIGHPAAYAKALAGAHVAIAVFGGMFLLMLFIDWLIEDRDIRWLPFEEKLAKIGAIDNITFLVAGAVLVVLAELLSNHTEVVLLTGMMSILTYTVVNSLDLLFNAETAMSLAKAGFATFLYLEVLDASFSFDDTVGSFAISNNIFLIAIGLGIGALFVRTLTVFLVRKGTLAEYKYLEHGAHWAIGSLAVLLLATTLVEIPEAVTGLIGVVFIGAAFYKSVIERRRNNVQLAKPRKRKRKPRTKVKVTG